jgi:hypothetical protein
VEVGNFKIGLVHGHQVGIKLFFSEEIKRKYSDSVIYFRLSLGEIMKAWECFNEKWMLIF